MVFLLGLGNFTSDSNFIDMLINIHCAKCIGIEAVPVTVEVDIASGLGIHLVGLADAAVKESLLRTITALQSMGFKIPGRKIVINLAPADMHKKGSGYDVPIALGIIAASKQRELPLLEKYIIEAIDEVRKKNLRLRFWGSREGLSDKILKLMNDVRKYADSAESVMPSDYWPYPSYGDLLFNL